MSRKRRKSSSIRLTGGIKQSAKELFSKQMLLTSGGYLIGVFGTNFVLNNFANYLPMATNPYARLAYKTFVPMLGAVALKKTNKDLAEGLMLNAGTTLVIGMLNMFAPSVAAQLTPVGAYLGGYMDSMSPMGAYLGGYAPSRGAEPLLASSGADPLLNTSPAFNNPAF